MPGMSNISKPRILHQLFFDSPDKETPSLYLRAELLLRKPWMPGMSDIEQLSLIFQNLGTPSEAVWPGAKGLPNYVEFQATPAPPLKSIFPKVASPYPAPFLPFHIEHATPHPTSMLSLYYFSFLFFFFGVA
jgi:hypothetical protein